LAPMRRGNGTGPRRGWCRSVGGQFRGRRRAAERLYYAAVDHGFGGLDQEVRARTAPARTSSDDLTLLREGIISYLAAMLRLPALTRLLARESLEASERLDYIWQQFMAPYVDWVERTIGRLVAAGTLRPVSAQLVFSLMYGLAAPWANLPALTSKFDDAGQPIDPVESAELIIRALSNSQGKID
jgi:hypothetical protein